MVSELEIPLDSGDFGLMDRKVVEALRRLPERSRFVRGLRAFVGFRQKGIPYDRPDRLGGQPKYRFKALAGLAADGLFSFSGAPLRLVTWLGRDDRGNRGGPDGLGGLGRDRAALRASGVGQPCWLSRSVWGRFRCSLWG